MLSASRVDAVCARVCVRAGADVCMCVRAKNTSPNRARTQQTARAMLCAAHTHAAIALVCVRVMVLHG